MSRYLSITRRHLLGVLAAMMPAAHAMPAPRRPLRETPKGSVMGNIPAHKPIAVKTEDRLSITAQDWGNPNGREILFIHGLSQSHLSWVRQLRSSLLTEHRVVTYDLRGHGNSEKPPDEAYYAEGRRWGDELAAVIAATGLKRPTLVGWSLGGVVITNYLARHGGDKIAAINFVDAGTKLDAAVFGDANARIGPTLVDPDLAVRIQGLRTFLRACFALQPDPGTFELMLAYNAMPPIEVHRAMTKITIDGADAALRALRVPVLVTHGEQDQLFRIAVSQYTASAVPNAQLSVYANAGHSPFFEDSARFNRELAALVRRS
jgi:non-heme chloroperoxidase